MTTQGQDISGTGAVAPVQHTDDIARVGNDDKAAQFLDKHHISGEAITFTAEEERSVLRKVDWRILPFLLLAYFFQQLDKSTLAYASVFDITVDAHLVGTQYSWLGSVLYLAQLVAQPLAALTLVKLPTGKVVAGAVFLWGSALCIMTACTNFPSLLALRILLGLFESLIGPSCIAITQMWWKRSEQTLRTSYWSAMNGVTFIVGSLLTYGLGHIKSDILFSYQFIFLVCGLLTVVYSIATLLVMPDSPMESKFLSDREKIIVIERLRANQMGIISRKWRWDHVYETMFDLKTWCWFFIVIAISIPSGGIGTFGALIIKSFGYNEFQTILFNIPFGLIQCIAIVGSGWLATKIGRKGPVIMLLCLTPIVGTVMLLEIPRTPNNRGLLLFAYYIISVYPGITPLIFSWEAQNTAGDTKRKWTTGVMFVGLCTGNVIGPLMYDTTQAPLYRKGLISSLAMFTLVIVLAGLISVYLILLNRRHLQARLAAGESANIIDRSMTCELSILPEGETECSGSDVDAFRDLTDLTNKKFIFVL